MTKRFGENGWPVGTLCVVKNTVGIDVNLRGKLVEIVKEKAWNDQFGREGYLVDQVENRATTPRWFCWEGMLEFRSFPVTLQNWTRNKVTRLFEIDFQISRELAEEKTAGDFPYGEVK